MSVVIITFVQISRMLKQHVAEANKIKYRLTRLQISLILMNLTKRTKTMLVSLSHSLLLCHTNRVNFLFSSCLLCVLFAVCITCDLLL